MQNWGENDDPTINCFNHVTPKNWSLHNTLEKFAYTNMQIVRSNLAKVKVALCDTTEL